MNKNFAFLLSCAFTVLGLASCSNKETDILKPEEKTHTVIFKAQTPAAEETKTALHLQVIPDWRNTDVDDVHIFEKETTSGGSYMMEASKVYMETPIDGSWSKAHFTAEFDNATVIVNPPVMAETKASASQFNYTAIMATREGDKYVIPSVQYPHEESLIDPKADFLVGHNGDTYSQSLHEQEVSLNFLRPVALARLAITNLEGETVSKVKITTANNITGYVTYDQVDFENNTVEAFDSDESNKELTLLFPEGKKRTTTFYAYFVCVPGKVQFSKIEVYTNKYIFKKEYATPASLTFKAGDFMNIALDMTVKEDNGVSRSELAAQTLTFINADEEPVTEVEFDLYTDGSAEDFILPTLVCEGVVDETLVTVTSSNEDVATVDEDGYVHLTGTTGEATITASVPGDDTHAAGTASYKITVTDSTPAPEAPKYYKAEELVDGQKYIIVSNGMAMTLVEKTATGTKANVTFTLGAVEVNAVDGVIETDENVAVWTASTQVEYYTSNNQSYEAGHFALECGDVYLQRLSNQSEQTLIVDGIPSTGKYYVWDYDGEYLSHLSSSTTTFYVGYNDGWVVVYNGTLPKVTLYTTTKPLTKQTLSFGEQPVTAKYDLNGGQWTVAVPELTGAQTAVTYSSNNDAIEVNATTGAITITNAAKKGDKATITATAAQTEEYASAKATYTIEIIDSSEPQPTGTTYYLVAKQEDVVEGTYLIVSAADAYVFDGTGTYQGGYATIADAENITLDSEKKTITINGETDAFDFTFAKSGNGFTITGEKGMIVAAANGTNVPTAEETYITFAETGGSVFLQRGSLENKPEALLFSTTRGSSSNEYLYYHTTNKIFKIGGSGSSNGIHLYFAGERAEQTVSFASEAFTYDLAGEGSWSPSVPAVSGTYNTELVYASSNENVIKYDKDNGWIFGTAAKKNATATITVTAPASDQYLSASASFTVTIVDSTPSTAATYYKADEIEAGKEYLIVSNGYALRNNDGALAAVEAGTGDSFQFEEESTDLWTATADGSAFTLTNNSQYLRRSGSNYNVSLSIGTASSTAANNQWTYDAENNYVMSGTYYLYYSTSNSKFSISTTKSDSHVAALYSTTAPLPAWEIAYDVEAAEYDLYTQTWTPSEPALTSATTDVTYASSDETVATVSNTGEITALKMGKTTITATAAADETHKKAMASYTLNVVNSDPDLPKYTKVTSTDGLIAGAKYLLVFEGLEGDTDGDGDPMVFKAILNSDETQFAKATTSAQPVTIVNNTIASDAMGDYQFTLETGYYLKADKANKYIYTGSSGGKDVMMAESSASHALSISFNNGIAEIKYDTRYLVWSISSHYFSANTAVSGQYSTGICLYKLEGSGGSTPEPPTPSTNPTYTLIEGDANLETGTYVIAEKTNTYLFNASGNNNGGYSTIGTTTGVTISGSTITLTSDIAKAHEFVITRTEDNLTIKQVGGTHEGQYMFATASVSNTYIGFQASAATFVLNKQTNTNLIYFKTTKGNSDSEYLYKKSSDSFFKLGGSGAPGGSDAGVLLYKKNVTE